MPTVISVRFRGAGKRQFVSPGELHLREGDDVLIPTTQGLEFATVTRNAFHLEDDKAPTNLPQVVRKASVQDYQKLQNNKQKEEQAFGICRERIAAHKLNMKLVSVEYSFDNSKLIANFTSETRVDFRALVKDLASIFKTRIELRQIGVRDEAKMLGGIGSCGRGLCCSNFLPEFQPVSIRMAKEQSLSLNPTKISGVCGRLMCCLKYEQEQYEKSRKRLPRLGKEVITPLGRGLVTQVNALLETVSVRVSTGDATDVHVYTADKVQKINPPQPQGKPRQVRELNLPTRDEEFLGTPDSLLDEDGIVPDEK